MRDPLLNKDGIDIDEAEIEAAFAIPIDSTDLPERQETIRTLTKKVASSAGPGTPVIASPFTGRKGSKTKPRTRASRRRLFDQVLISCLIMFTEGFYQTQVFPYGPAMAEVLRGTTASVGTCTGLLFTAQSCGMLATAYVWANISNWYGRRICLLTGLVSSMVLSVAMAVTTDYWLFIALRLISGVMNSNLSIMRTALREMYHHEDEDDTQAFSTLSVAFGASAVCGPSWGGLVYGTFLPVGGNWQQPWSLSFLVCTLMYVVCLVVTAVWLPETAFLDKMPGEQFKAAQAKNGGAQRSTPKPGLLRDGNFILLLLMGGGHSYIFTGWEIAYPLMARLPSSVGGEQWSTSSVGITFLSGSLFLMLYSLFVYPPVAKKMKVIRIWIYSALPPLLAYFAFPHMLSYLFENGYGGDSITVVVLNYGAQAIISMLFGSGFISIQLLLNSYVSSMPNSSDLLALANSLLVSTQALVRAISPIMTGSLFTLGLKEVYLSRSLPFDHLGVVGFLTVVLPALLFERRSRRRNSVPPSPAPKR